MPDGKKEVALPEALAAGLAEGIAPIAPLPDRAAAAKARIVEYLRTQPTRQVSDAT